TLKDVADVHAQIAATQSDAQAQQLQVANIQTQAMLQPLVRQERDSENDRLRICKYRAYLAAGTDGLVAAPNCAAAAASGGGFQLTSFTGSPFGGTPGGGGNALGTMMATGWGSDAANNATALGVNPEALAATCVIESGCQNVAGSGTVSGPFQMTDATYSADLQRALAANPDLASVATGGKADPTTQSIAAAQDLHTTAIGLQAMGISNPTVLDARGGYQFGAAYAARLATADAGQSMSSIVTTLTPAQLQANGVTPGMTVGQWRAGIASKLGASATAPILASNT
ncbi:MAG: hypothetical protein J0H57_19560, partial [Rhodospirillales bacterium]|nr:hypothetical protein [Rhodospirillales bacterium]